MNRYEIHIPVRYNDGTAVEQHKIDQTQTELTDRFGGVTVAGPIKGWWFDDGTVYQDDQLLFVVDTEDGDPRFWYSYADELKRRFDQHELYVVAYSVHVLEHDTEEETLALATAPAFGSELRA
ncbi:MAG TPA: hypothetical protein QGH10_27050 [Armatimonadota bacterium]|jgi:hypothetical protein|nr:hypothetical protein [Armatimonadota bacterium]